jgi:hypothetical protein
MSEDPACAIAEICSSGGRGRMERVVSLVESVEKAMRPLLLGKALHLVTNRSIAYAGDLPVDFLSFCFGQYPSYHVSQEWLITSCFSNRSPAFLEYLLLPG